MKRLLTLLFFFNCWGITGFAQKAQSLHQAIRYIKLANTLREVDKSDAAINLLQRALPATKTTSLYWEAVTNELLGLSYHDLHDTSAALSYLQRAGAQYLKLKYVASAWGVNEIVRNLSNKNLYAGIQIGSSSIKLAILKTKYETDFYEKDIKSIADIANPSITLFADVSGGLRAEQDALRACLDSIQRYNIPNERVFIVLSNDVREELARNPDSRRKVYDQLSRALPNSNLKIDTTLTANREAELFTTGAIPRKVWSTTSALDLGKSSTVGGYFDVGPSPGSKAFHGINLPFGTNSLVDKIDAKRSLNMDAYKREAQRVIKALSDSIFTNRFNTSNRGLQQRNTVGVGGDIVWALVTYLHPERAGFTAVPVTMDDVERFKRLALTDYRELTKPNLNTVTDPAVRNKVEKDITALQSHLNEKQLIAGALWLEAIMKAYSTAATPKRFVFVRNADIGWVTGKFLETINYEYESTIAKGALYTR
ncbi:tetratricopeptide repeat protein [Spirosoma sp. HMF4905]|uniref:Tetratricopeptide repeat protein n=1 Tax=Spirosoma arboris TaxID=2682092 RepID=A0A7K1S8R5_9BACT|nr:tetratricopeptide repeat protein [Spirosoma arboris]MVM30038.1 tetratricopeptide repeat protein [Spirosoma arboris]